MGIFLTTTTIILYVLTVFNTYFFIRCARVSKFRNKIITRIHMLNLRDIKDEKEVNFLRYKEYEKVKFEKMLFSFKKLRVSNYYDDIKFLE